MNLEQTFLEIFRQVYVAVYFNKCDTAPGAKRIWLRNIQPEIVMIAKEFRGFSKAGDASRSYAYFQKCTKCFPPQTPKP